MKNLIYGLILFSTLSITKLNAQISEVGLVAYYPFNGNANDRSGNCIHGYVNNAQLAIDRFGFINSAYHFNGTTDQYISVPGNEFALNEFSYSVWARTENIPDPGDFTSIISIAGADFRDQSIALRNDGYGATTYNSDFSNYVLYSKIPTPFELWTHLVMTRSNNVVRFYQNGIMVHEIFNSNFLSPFYDWGLEMFIGMRHNYTKPFKGDIDDIRIYNRALHEDEVDQLYKEHVCFKEIAVTDTLFINVSLTALFPEAYKVTLKVYPNPTADHIIIDAGDISQLSGYSMRITNASGVEVYETNITQKVYELDMNKWLGSGVYFLYLIDNNQKIVDVKKLILQ